MFCKEILALAQFPHKKEFVASPQRFACVLSTQTRGMRHAHHASAQDPRTELALPTHCSKLVHLRRHAATIARKRLSKNPLVSA
jgi:hypothetical protein